LAALRKSGNAKETNWEGVNTRAYATLALPRLNAGLLVGQQAKRAQPQSRRVKARRNRKRARLN